MIDFRYGVVLGPLDESHQEQARAWRNEHAVWQWCRQHDLISDQDQMRWFHSQSKDPSIRMYSIQIPKGDNEWTLIGVCGLTSIDLINRRAEFSLYIGPKHRGNEYGKRALMTLMAHGFMNFGLNCIWGESFDGNPAVKIFEQVGFRREGTRRQFYFRNGKFIDALLFSILKKEWDKCSSS